MERNDRKDNSLQGGRSCLKQTARSKCLEITTSLFVVIRRYRRRDNEITFFFFLRPNSFGSNE
jgi:hypothetical protein